MSEMVKIVYNACYGGFSLSLDGVILGRKLSNNPKWADIVIGGECYTDGEICKDYGFGFHLGSDFSRSDLILVEIVETLKEKASGQLSELKITEVPKGTKYRIDEYDGFESVETIDSYEWSIA